MSEPFESIRLVSDRIDEHSIDQGPQPDHTIALAAEALLREHPDALVCALGNDGLIVPIPRSIGLWGQAAIEGRGLIDNVVNADRKTVIDTWRAAQTEGAAKNRVRLLREPARWMTLHFLNLREQYGVLLGIVIPTDELAEDHGAADEVSATKPRMSTLKEDETGLVLDCDEAFTQMFGYTPADVLGQHVLDQIHPDDQARAIEGWLTMLSTRRMQQIRMRRRRKGEEGWVWVDSTVHNYLNQPDRNHVLVEIIDVSAEMAAQEEVQEREELLRRLMDAMPDGVIQVDTDRNVIFRNARVLEILRVPGQIAAEQARSHQEAEEGTKARKIPPISMGALFSSVTERSAAAFHMALAQVLDEGVDQDVEVDVVPPAAEPRRVLMSLRALRRPGGVSGAIATVLDITDSARAREELERRATLDSLTHCHNRTSILTALQNELDGKTRNETAVVFVDLDKFKAVNDTLGHAAGDEALVNVAERLKRATRSEDRVGRLGGDEFLLVIRGLPEPEVALGVAQRISDSLRTPLQLSCGPVELSASIGVAFAGDKRMTADELVKRADAAMYRSKERREGLPVLTGEPQPR
jgi:diguanylate cyclase (GGDEF)-like protein/PAS domain S-box-containing protein